MGKVLSNLWFSLIMISKYILLIHSRLLHYFPPALHLHALPHTKPELWKLHLFSVAGRKRGVCSSSTQNFYHHQKLPYFKLFTLCWDVFLWKQQWQKPASFRQSCRFCTSVCGNQYFLPLYLPWFIHGIFKEEWKLSHQVVSVVEAWILYIKKDDFVSFGIILDEVNGGWRLPGKEMCRGKKWIVVGRHPVGPWWKPWIIIWMFWVMDFGSSTRLQLQKSLSVHLSVQ